MFSRVFSDVLRVTSAVHATVISAERELQGGGSADDPAEEGAAPK